MKQIEAKEEEMGKRKKTRVEEMKKLKQKRGGGRNKKAAK
jgi:hypothetical protein